MFLIYRNTHDEQLSAIRTYTDTLQDYYAPALNMVLACYAIRNIVNSCPHIWHTDHAYINLVGITEVLEHMNPNSNSAVANAINLMISTVDNALYEADFATLDPFEHLENLRF